MTTKKANTLTIKSKDPLKKKKQIVTAKSGAKDTSIGVASRKKKPSIATKTPQKATTDKNALSRPKIKITGEERQTMVNEAAYLVSLKRESGICYQELDWAQAETVIDMIFEVS